MTTLRLILMSTQLSVIKTIIITQFSWLVVMFSLIISKFMAIMMKAMITKILTNMSLILVKKKGVRFSAVLNEVIDLINLKKVLDSLLSWLNQFLSESRVRLTSLEDDLKACDTYYVSKLQFQDKY